MWATCGSHAPKKIDGASVPTLVDRLGYVDVEGNARARILLFNMGNVFRFHMNAAHGNSRQLALPMVFRAPPPFRSSTPEAVRNGPANV